MRRSLKEQKRIIAGKNDEIDCLGKEIENMLDRHGEGLAHVRRAYEERLDEEKGFRMRTMRRVKELEERERVDKQQQSEKGMLLQRVDERLSNLIQHAAADAVESTGENGTLDRDHYAVGVRVPPSFSETCALKDEVIL